MWKGMLTLSVANVVLTSGLSHLSAFTNAAGFRKMYLRSLHWIWFYLSFSPEFLSQFYCTSRKHRLTTKGWRISHFVMSVHPWKDKSKMYINEKDQQDAHVWSFSFIWIAMHGSQNVKSASAPQTKQIYRYKNTKERLYKTNIAMWYTKICRQKHLTAISFLFTNWYTRELL
jgi:hypothetical protein